MTEKVLKSYVVTGLSGYTLTTKKLNFENVNPRFVWSLEYVGQRDYENKW